MPNHGKARTRRAIAELEHYPKLKNVYRSDFGEAGSIGLPQYWVQSGSLMLYSYDFRLTALHGYDVNGKTFRYVAKARGMHVGAVLTPSWTDRDCDGTFEEYRSGGGHALDDLPQWVLNASRD